MDVRVFFRIYEIRMSESENMLPCEDCDLNGTRKVHECGKYFNSCPLPECFNFKMKYQDEE